MSKYRSLWWSVVAGCALPLGAWAQTQVVLDFPAQPLAETLRALGKRTETNILIDPKLVKGIQAPALKGTLTTDEALRQLLQGTALSYRFVDAHTVVLKPLPAEGEKETSTTGEAGGFDRALLADEVLVTGSHIRGGESPSPVISIDAERIREQGFTDLGEVIRNVPQNFRGGQNPGIVGVVENISNRNVSGGSGLNLRGLGPDATLTLLNGRRMAYDGANQAVDITAIPVEAVERLEIVADGASAIYGSDAVAGVGNVVLKRDFEGVTLGARYARSKDGGLTTREYQATAGTTWSGGGFIATYQDVSADPIYKDQRDYTRNVLAPSTIYAGSDSGSGLLSAHQSLGEFVEVRLDALRTERDVLIYSANTNYYVYSTPQAQTWLVSPSADISLPGDWRLTIGATWAEGRLNSHDLLVPAAGTATLTRSCACNDSRSYDASVEGPLFALGGGAARLAVGAGHRTNKYRLSGNSARFQGEESTRFAYAELGLPFIGPNSGLAGIHKLALTAAVRGEDYDTFGSVSTPKLGVVYAPSADISVKGSWGKSFKAPTLNQRHTLSYVYLDPASWYGSYPEDQNVLFTGGGNADLGPERARTWTASLAFHPESIAALEAEVTWFEIDYTDRVVSPLNYSSNEILLNPSNAPYVTFAPSADQQAALLASVDTDNTGGNFDPDSVIAIASTRYANATLQEIRGIDLSAAYGFDLGTSRLTIRGAASWLESCQQTTVGQASFDLAGNRGSPAETNGRLGAVWERGALMASTFINYTEGVVVPGGASGTGVEGASQTTGSFTTVDATLRYDASMHGGAWSGLELVVSAQNLFDRAPPMYRTTSNLVVRYDSTNYSAIGRFLSVSIAKHW